MGAAKVNSVPRFLLYGAGCFTIIIILRKARKNLGPNIFDAQNTNSFSSSFCSDFERNCLFLTSAASTIVDRPIIFQV